MANAKWILNPILVHKAYRQCLLACLLCLLVLLGCCQCNLCESPLVAHPGRGLHGVATRLYAISRAALSLALALALCFQPSEVT